VRAAPPGGGQTIDDVLSGWQLNLVISETMHRKLHFIVDHYQEVMVTLSESVMKSTCSAHWRRTGDDVIFGWH